MIGPKSSGWYILINKSPQILKFRPFYFFVEFKMHNIKNSSFLFKFLTYYIFQIENQIKFNIFLSTVVYLSSRSDFYFQKKLIFISDNQSNRTINFNIKTKVSSNDQTWYNSCFYQSYLRIISTIVAANLV